MRKVLLASALVAGMSSAALAGDTVVDAAIGSKDHTTLVSAVTAAGLVDTLKGAGPFTVFAPTNAAFEALPAGTVDGLLKPEAKDQLTKILTCHVVPSQALAADVAKMIADGSGMAKIKTVGGCELTAKLEGDKVMIMDEAGGAATVTTADLKGSNGVIHVVDKVLMPKS
jgi:uncharacterized surface protein with fasciclin (FAS1) repeats